MGGVPASGVPSRPPAGAAQVHVFRDEHGVPCGTSAVVGGTPWLYTPPLVAYRFDLPAYQVTAFADAPTAVVADHYLRAVLPLAWHLQGGEALHAAAVRGPAGVIVLCATAGTGKSTTAWGLAARGLTPWADDAVAVELMGETPMAYPLPFRPRLLPDTAARLGTADGAVVAPAAEPVPVTAVCVLERTDSPDAPVVAVTPLTGADALSPLLANAYYFATGDPARLRTTTLAYLDLAARVPVLAVRFQPGLGHLDQVLDGILAALPPPPATTASAAPPVPAP
jgi:hypothetical protein